MRTGALPTLMSDSGEAADDADGAAAQHGREIWIEKYRPESLDDVVGQPDVVERLQSYIEQDDLPNLLFSGPAGVGKCVTGETPVLTNRGVERIEDVVGDVDGFADPDDDLAVLSFGDDGRFEYVQPSQVFGKEAAALRRVETRDGGTMTVTPEHRLLVVDESGLEWREAAALSDGDRIARPLTAPVPETDPTIDWLEALDGDRVFGTVSEEFARRHDISVAANDVGTKRAVAERLREGDSVEEIVDELDTPRETVEAYRRQFDGADLDATATTCPLSTLRTLDVSTETLRGAIEAVEYVTESNERSPPMTPPSSLSPELAEFVGLAVSEARIETGQIEFYNTDHELLDRFDRIGRELFELDPTRGEQSDVPYVEFRSRALTHYLNACFDVVAGIVDGDGIGSTLVSAPSEARSAFLRAVCDAEGYVTRTDTTGAVEVTQKNPRVVTLLSYLLASCGIPSRRTVERKTANGTGIEREYHTLRISGAAHLARFEEAIGFTLEEKADRLADYAARETNPNHDTMPAQVAVGDLCEALFLTKSDLVEAETDSATRDRSAHVADLDRVVDAAVERIETAQAVQEETADLRRSIERLAAIPATWTAERDRLEPIETRRELESETGVRSDRLLEYADGRRAPTARRTERLLSAVGAVGETPDVEAVQERLRDAIESLGVPYERVADGTDLRGTDVIDLLENDDDDDHDFGSLPRFETVADRVTEVAAKMLTEAVLEQLTTLDRLTTGELYFDWVDAVTEVDEPRRVYDLTVPDRRNYVAGRVPTVVHNTTSAVSIARTVYGEDWRENFLELNASDDRGIDVVRGRIKDFARTSFGGYDHRIVFLDEADSLCLPPGTAVVTGSPSSPEVRPIESVAEDGESMPSVDFETNAVQPDTGRLVDAGVADIFELEQEDGRSITASLTHPFFVVGAGGELVERELQELEPGDELADFRHELDLTRCEVCGDWTAGRGCSLDPDGDGDRDRAAVVSDGGRREVATVEVHGVEYSHRGRAYNVTMDGTPNFVLGNGVLTHNTDDAQAALRRTMEQFSDNTRFVLSCNYSSRIIDPIQSRCAVFRFSPLSAAAVAEYVREIAAAEEIEVTDDGLEALTYVADGDMRRAINALQAAAVTGEVVDEAAVYAITATARPEEIEEMVTEALDGDFVAARGTLDELLTDRGIAGGDVIDQLHRSVWDYDLSETAAVRVLDRLGEADYRIAAGANERIQLESLLAAVAREGHEE
jgi:DNA polymerase III delta prime subunit